MKAETADLPARLMTLSVPPLDISKSKSMLEQGVFVAVHDEKEVARHPSQRRDLDYAQEGGLAEEVQGAHKTARAPARKKCKFRASGPWVFVYFFCTFAKVSGGELGGGHGVEVDGPMDGQPSCLGQHVAMAVPFAVGEVVLQVGGRDGGVGAADLALLLGFVVAQGADY